jgi:alcohol dehydrogenase (NADP+)
MYNTRAYSAASATSPLASTTIPRRDPTEHDVQIEIQFCGICQSDLHSVRNEWSEFMPTKYPIVPGHEIVGRVTKVGSAFLPEPEQLPGRSPRRPHLRWLLR